MSPFIKSAALSVLFFSCDKPKYLTEYELNKFTSDEGNGLVRTVRCGDTEVKVTYRPTDLLVTQELKSYRQPETNQILVARKKYENHYYFILSLSKGGNELLNPANQGNFGFSELLQTISFRMGEKINLTTHNQDTIALSDYIHDRTFGMGQSNNILLVFEKTKAIGQVYVDFNLDEFGIGIGKQSFRFFIEDIENCPKIYSTPNPVSSKL